MRHLNNIIDIAETLTTAELLAIANQCEMVRAYLNRRCGQRRREGRLSQSSEFPRVA